MGLLGDIRARATQQTLSLVETVDGTAQKTYADSVGNVSAADVSVDGQVQPLMHVPNSSGLKIAIGMKVKINFSKGSRHSPQIIGGSGSATSSVIASATGSAATASTPKSLAGYPFVLQQADERTPDGYVLMPGSNLLIVGTTGIGASGTALTYNNMTLSAAPLVMAALPPVTSPGLLGGTVVDLMDSYGNSLGMYRFDIAALTWRRRDSGGGSSVTGLGTAAYKDVPATGNASAGQVVLGNDTRLTYSASGIAISPPPYYVMKYLFNAINAVPVATDFASAPQLTYFANGGDGSLRFETPGLGLNAYWQMKIKNTNTTSVTVTWSVPQIDNYGSAAWNGTSLFNLNNSSTGASGTFSIAAGTTGLLELFYANANSGIYNPSNQGTFWFFMDALLKAGVQFVDAVTGQPPPGTVQQTDINNWNANLTGLAAEATIRFNADVAEAAARSAGDALALKIASNLGDLANAGASRTNLGLGTAATKDAPAWGNASAVQAVLGSDTRLAAAGTALQKRRCAITFRPSAPTTPDTAPDISQETRLPLGSANAINYWKVMSATLRTGVPNASSTTVQLYYAPSGNAVFGAGTAVLSTALTESGTTSVEISTTAFTGTLASVGLAGGSILAPQFSALGGTKVSLEIEMEEV